MTEKLSKAIDGIAEESIRRSLRIIEAALEERFGSTAASTETAWLIEWPPSPDHQPRWWNPVHGWTVDPNRALRLARKEDAEALIAGSHSLNGVPTEHKWLVAGRAASPTRRRGVMEKLSKRQRADLEDIIERGLCEEWKAWEILDKVLSRLADATAENLCERFYDDGTECVIWQYLDEDERQKWRRLANTVHAALQHQEVRDDQ